MKSKGGAWAAAVVVHRVEGMDGSTAGVSLFRRIKWGKGVDGFGSVDRDHVVSRAKLLSQLLRHWYGADHLGGFLAWK